MMAARRASYRISNPMLAKHADLFTITDRATVQHNLPPSIIAPAPSCRRHIHPPARRRHQFPIAPVAPPVPNLPRLRALALFGLQPPQRMEASSCRRPKTYTRTDIRHASQSLENAVICRPGTLGVLGRGCPLARGECA